jgi:GT2 family glycosyltransferase
MDVSVIILTWNSERHIERCLGSLCADLEGQGACEVFIVDNGSSDRTVAILQEFQKKNPSLIKPIFLDKNTGTTYSRNLALKKAEGKHIVIMDSDVEIPRGTLSQLRKTLESDERIGLVAPRLVYSNGSFQKSVDDFPTLFGKIRRYLFLKSIERAEGESGQKPMIREVDYAISAMWVLKRSVVEKIGLLDEAIFYSPEDADYCLRMKKAGYKVVFDPSVYAVHHAQEISRGFKINAAAISHIKGLLYYFKKHNR